MDVAAVAVATAGGDNDGDDDPAGRRERSRSREISTLFRRRSCERPAARSTTGDKLSGAGARTPNE